MIFEFEITAVTYEEHRDYVSKVLVFDSAIEGNRLFRFKDSSTNHFGSVSEDALDFSGNVFHYGELFLKCLNPISIPKTVVDILQLAQECVGDRASERDTDAERSMKTCIDAFNAMYGTELTEEQGWMFMVFLKASRAKGGKFKLDDYVDMAAYAGLAGECHGSKVQ